MQESLDELSKTWGIPPEIYDLHLGKRDDLTEKIIQVGGVYFHIPFLATPQLYVLWKCLWPDCTNCCKKPVRLPITEDDVELMQKKLGYQTKSDFIKNETNIITYEDKISKDLLITRSMLSMKRKKDETVDDDGKKISCRFLTSSGCGIHPDKPGVCWMFPFRPWRESDDKWWKVEPHAKFVFTGECPGFYLDKSLDSLMPTLEQYSKMINEYLVSTHRSERKGFIATSKIIRNRFMGNVYSTLANLRR
jgi:Fe-S-cluster containining protein